MEKQAEIEKFMFQFPTGQKQIIDGEEVTLLSLSQSDLFFVADKIVKFYNENTVDPAHQLSLPASKEINFLYKWFYDNREDPRFIKILTTLSLELSSPKTVTRQ